MKTDKIIEQAIIRKGEQNTLRVLGRIESTDELRHIMHSTERKYRPLWLRKQVWAFASAVAVVAVVVTIGLQPRYSNEELYSRWSEKVAYESAVLRGEDESQVAFEAVLALAVEGKTNEAIDGFTKIATDRESEYVEDAEWYLALTYLQIGERSRAKEILSQIVKTTGVYSIDATELLRELETKRWF